MTNYKKFSASQMRQKLQKAAKSMDITKLSGTVQQAIKEKIDTVITVLFCAFIIWIIVVIAIRGPSSPEKILPSPTPFPLFYTTKTPEETTSTF